MKRKTTTTSQNCLKRKYKRMCVSVCTNTQGATKEMKI